MQTCDNIKTTRRRMRKGVQNGIPKRHTDDEPKQTPPKKSKKEPDTKDHGGGNELKESFATTHPDNHDDPTAAVRYLDGSNYCVKLVRYHNHCGCIYDPTFKGRIQSCGYDIEAQVCAPAGCGTRGDGRSRTCRTMVLRMVRSKRELDELHR
eukprot:scaffold105445_cov43-Attheya_sp.AAC.2